MRYTKKVDKKRKEKDTLEKKAINDIKQKQRDDFQRKIDSDKENKIIEDVKLINSTQAKWNVVKKMEISSICVLYGNIKINENLIVEKGGENQLFSFLKIVSFLNDFRNKIITDRNEIDLTDDFFDKSRKEQYSKDISYSIYKIIRFSDIDNFFESRIKTLEYYENIANTMLVFYLNDSKILYFEIYQAFEKLGVFDSSWQKLVLKKMDDIHEVLKEMNDEMSEINNNFQNLVDSTETISKELDSINSTIKTGNMIQAISAYQLWRMNNKINN